MCASTARCPKQVTCADGALKRPWRRREQQLDLAQVVIHDRGVAERGALLLAAMNLADERVDIDDQPPLARAAAGLPRTLQRQSEDAIELADMPERERAQDVPSVEGART
jgi:hypothetical protein